MGKISFGDFLLVSKVLLHACIYCDCECVDFSNGEILGLCLCPANPVHPIGLAHTNCSLFRYSCTRARGHIFSTTCSIPPVFHSRAESPLGKISGDHRMIILSLISYSATHACHFDVRTTERTEVHMCESVGLNFGRRNQNPPGIMLGGR